MPCFGKPFPPQQRSGVEQQVRKQELQAKSWTSPAVGLIRPIEEPIAGAAGRKFGQALAEELINLIKDRS
jgi:hypothetical protein